MDIFDKVIKKTGEFAEKAVVVSKEAAGTAKANIQTTTTRHHLKDVYSKIGELYYHQLGGMAPHSEYVSLFAEIKEDLDKIESYSMEKEVYQECFGCGNTNSYDSKYCSKCGTKLK